MTTGKTIISQLISIIIIVAIGSLIWFIVSHDESIPDIIQSFGYLEIVPPSTLYGPGTINTIEKISKNKVKLYPTCDMDVSVLSKMTSSSSTVDQTMIQKLDKRFSISSQIRNLIFSEISDNEQNALRADSWNINAYLRGRPGGRLRHTCPV